jgi:hypothetical protein
VKSNVPMLNHKCRNVKSQMERLTVMCRPRKQEKVVHNPSLGCLLDVPFETNPAEYMAGNISLVACCNLS